MEYYKSRKGKKYLKDNQSYYIILNNSVLIKFFPDVKQFETLNWLETKEKKHIELLEDFKKAIVEKELLLKQKEKEEKKERRERAKLAKQELQDRLNSTYAGQLIINYYGKRLALNHEKELDTVQSILNGEIVHLIYYTGSGKWSKISSGKFLTIKWIFEKSNVSFHIENDAPRGGAWGEHIVIDDLVVKRASKIDWLKAKIRQAN